MNQRRTIFQSCHRSIIAAASLTTALLFTSCGHEHKEGDGHDHDTAAAHDKAEGHGHEEESPSGASFKAGRGVLVTAETRKILGVEVADVTEQKISAEIRFNVQVFGEKHSHSIRENDHSGCDVHGSGFVPLDQASALRAGQRVQVVSRSNESLAGVVLAVEKALTLGESEVIVGLTNATENLKPGDFVAAIITLPREDVVTVIPRSALLRTAEGTFVYAVNGEAFFRTAVKVGSASGDLLEVTDGLFAGDSVVTKPVETFYLIELRATKGGGHCH